jgi:hypothetical protein
MQDFNRIPVVLIALQYAYRRQNNIEWSSSLSLGRDWPGPCCGRSTGTLMSARYKRMKTDPERWNPVGI